MVVIVIVSFTLSEPRPLTDDELATLNAVVSEDLERYPLDHEHEWYRGKLKGHMYTGHLEDVIKSLPKGFTASVQGDAPLSMHAAVLAELRHINAKLVAIDAPFDRYPQQYSRDLGAHVPSEALLRVRETMVLDNCCTEVLDGKLEEGWRLLAVCPQPDQRRPDYVIGRFDRE